MSGKQGAAAQVLSTEETQAQFLEKGKKTVQVEAFYMKRCLDGGKLMDALKHASNMVGQLRTSLLTPKQYYELYIYCFDQLKYLETYLLDEKETRGTKMSKLYELVQYAGNILPRLYLLITVGSAYIRSQEVAAKDILYDLVEMCRGIQHPLRGLFLRNYLSEMTKDKLPDEGNQYEGKGGAVSDSIEFILANFTEMNKLWVRMEPQKGSAMPKERERKQKERDDLRLLVGKNLARLGQLDGVDANIYKTLVLPRILKQVVSCKDTIAQQYLMECVVQIFPDEYHLMTLEELLSTCAQLEPTVNVKVIVVSLLNRLANFTIENNEGTDNVSIVDVDGQKEKLNIFKMFFGQLKVLLEKQDEESVTSTADQLEMLVALLNLSLKYYPKVVTNVDEVLEFTATLLASKGKKCSERNEIQSVVKLLNIPLSTFSVVVVLDLQIAKILEYLDYNTRKRVAIDFMKSLVENETYITEPDILKRMFEFVSPITHDQDDQPKEEEWDEEDFEYEQNLVASVLHMVQNPNPGKTFVMCVIAREALASAGTPIKRLHHVVPPIVFKVLSLTSVIHKEASEEVWAQKGKEIFQFVYKTVITLKADRPLLSLKLFLQAAQTASQCGFEMIANDFLCESLLLFEELAHSSEEQKNCLVLIISALNSIKSLDDEKYDALTTKCAHHSARLLKKEDQCRLILMCSHLFAKSGSGQSDGNADRFTLDCLQKCLRVADNSMETGTKVQLFAEILNECLYFFQRKSETVTIPFLNSLIDLIATNIAGDRAAVDPATLTYHENTLNYIRYQQQQTGSMWDGIELS